ncbi:MAG: hypothetical protein OWR62_13440 [Sulfobacillus thermotolerans]|nr:hypothetical protein [Sulfobacillus thermotolerans]
MNSGPDPWHVDSLMQRLQDAIGCMADDYHHHASPSRIYQHLVLMHEILEALAVQLPVVSGPLPIRRQMERHAHFGTEEV